MFFKIKEISIHFYITINIFILYQYINISFLHMIFNLDFIPISEMDSEALFFKFHYFGFELLGWFHPLNFNGRCDYFNTSWW